MRAQQIKTGADYYICRYPHRYHHFNIERMDERDWRFFEEQAVRARVIERDPHRHSAYRCLVVDPGSGEPYDGQTQSLFRSAQFMAPWDVWAEAFLDYFQQQTDREYERLLELAQERLASAERHAAEWREKTLREASRTLEHAREVLRSEALITTGLLGAFIELEYPRGNPHDRSIAEAQAELAKIEGNDIRSKSR